MMCARLGRLLLICEWVVESGLSDDCEDAIENPAWLERHLTVSVNCTDCLVC